MARKRLMESLFIHRYNPFHAMTILVILAIATAIALYIRAAVALPQSQTFDDSRTDFDALRLLSDPSAPNYYEAPAENAAEQPDDRFWRAVLGGVVTFLLLYLLAEHQKTTPVATKPPTTASAFSVDYPTYPILGLGGSEVYVLYLQTYNTPEGATLVANRYPNEKIVAIPIGSNEYWACILCDTYGEALQLLENWNQKRDLWEKYGFEPSVKKIQVQKGA